jgi:hypothetical protein
MLSMSSGSRARRCIDAIFVVFFVFAKVAKITDFAKKTGSRGMSKNVKKC